MNRNMIAAASVMLILLAGVAFAAKPDFAESQAGSGRTVNLPVHAVEVSDGLYYLGNAFHEGRLVQGYAFVKYKDGFAKPPWAGGGKPKTESKCYAVLAKGAKWKATEPYVLDTTNSDGLSARDIEAWTEAGIEAWDSQVEFDIFGPRDESASVDGAETSAPDGKNEIFFGDIKEPGAIAVTYVWGIWGGSPRWREIVEYDMVLDDPDFEWGYAGTTDEEGLGDTGVMDYWNIFTHEIGHAAGMGHPEDSCSGETMYRFSTEGETKKRTLGSGDIEGISGLY
jgi:hypothetical protein